MPSAPQNIRPDTRREWGCPRSLPHHAPSSGAGHRLSVVQPDLTRQSLPRAVKGLKPRVSNPAQIFTPRSQKQQQLAQLLLSTHHRPPHAREPPAWDSTTLCTVELGVPLPESSIAPSNIWSRLSPPQPTLTTHFRSRTHTSHPPTPVTLQALQKAGFTTVLRG